MTVPERIGKYTVSEVLGQGAMGVVYKAFDPHIRRAVAIKVIHKALLGDDAAHDSIAARFRNEAQAVGRVAHPGVVAIHEFGEDADTAYIVMEYVPGRNLDQVLAGTPLLDAAQLLRIMDQLLTALAAAHAGGVWHRDIKPANLLLTADGNVKLTDFGIARIEHAGLTQAASSIGTPGYMAPEQYSGEGIDHRADIFACGALLYRLLTARPAFSGSAETIMYRILHEQPPAASVASLGRRPVAYDAVVAKALAKRPADRFDSAAAMRQALLAAASTGTVDDDATVIVAPGGWSRAVESAASPAATAATTVAGWDVAELSRIERALASHVGPMARLMVRQAAARHGDVVGLATALSEHIDQPADRQRFMSRATEGSQAQPVVPAAATVAATTATPSAPLGDDFRTQALQVMTRHMGPIARVVVKRAADQGGADRARFVALLVEAAAADDRSALQRELDALR